MPRFPRFSAAVAAVLLLTSVAGTPAFGADEAPLPLYRVDVVAPGGVATAINELGDVVGWQTVNGNPRAFIYRSGVLTLLPTPLDRPLSIARDVNDQGVVVGSAYKTIIDEPGTAMRWTPGTSGWTVRDLGFLPDDLVSEAKGLNEVGQIVGRSNPRSFLYEHGFLFTDSAGMAPITAVSNTFVAEDINEVGVTVGTGYSTAQRVDTATGLSTDLGSLAPYAYSYAYAINDAGVISGALTTASGNAQVVARYADATGWQVLGGIGGSSSSSVSNIGWGINSAGTVVGQGWPRTGSQPPQRAVIYLDSHGTLLYVDDLVEAGTPWSVYGAFDINDKGQIVGHARNWLTGATAAVRLTQVGTLAVPAPPSGLTATPYAATTSQEPNRIDLRWLDNAVDETGFEVERRQVDALGTPLSAFGRIAGVSANVTTYADIAITLGARYEYRVRALGIAGASPYSNVATATAPATAPDAIPPVVAITSPADLATVSGRLLVKVDASDNVGVVRVELVVDTTLLGSCTLSTGQTYVCKWDTRRWSDGGWTLYARAWDKAGNLGIDAVSVFVRNGRRH